MFTWRIFWFLSGVIALALGIVGIILPLLPTTPFVILAAFAFGKSAPSFQRRLEENRIFGPIIADWRARGAIAPKYKATAVTMMGAVLALSIWTGFSPVVIGIQAVCIAAAATFILTRPSE